MLKQIKKHAGAFASKAALFFIRLITDKKMPQKVIEWRYSHFSFSQFGEDIVILDALDFLRL